MAGGHCLDVRRSAIFPTWMSKKLWGGHTWLWYFSNSCGQTLPVFFFDVLFKNSGFFGQKLFSRHSIFSWYCNKIWKMYCLGEKITKSNQKVQIISIFLEVCTIFKFEIELVGQIEIRWKIIFCDRCLYFCSFFCFHSYFVLPMLRHPPKKHVFVVLKAKQHILFCLGQIFENTMSCRGKSLPVF